MLFLWHGQKGRQKCVVKNNLTTDYAYGTKEVVQNNSSSFAYSNADSICAGTVSQTHYY